MQSEKWVETTMDLDKLDKKILTLLQTDSCLTNNELAEKVGLSPSPCWRRVKRLEEGEVKKYNSINNKP